MRLLIASAAILSVGFCGLFGTEQAVAVTGRLTCNGSPAENVKIKLYEREIIHDTLLEEQLTDSKGSFSVKGHKKEMSTIDPKVNIYHRCNYEPLIPTCFKKISVKIPKNFVTEGEVAEKTFDIGELNLGGAFSGQSTDCIN